MRYLYQKDERALPGNLRNLMYIFLDPPEILSLTTSSLAFFSLHFSSLFFSSLLFSSLLFSSLLFLGP
jgi:hypothetical protein